MTLLIKEKRENLKIKQNELAVIIGVSPSVIANWESGVAAPRVKDLPKIASALCCTINDLFPPAK